MEPFALFVGSRFRVNPLPGGEAQKHKAPWCADVRAGAPSGTRLIFVGEQSG
jgi:hypothetical protein